MNHHTTHFYRLHHRACVDVMNAYSVASRAAIVDDKDPRTYNTEFVST